jgi:hypothetical protein
VFVAVAVGIGGAVAKWDALVVEYHVWRLRQMNDRWMVHHAALARMAQPTETPPIDWGDFVPDDVLARHDPKEFTAEIVRDYVHVTFYDKDTGYLHIAWARRNAGGVYAVFWCIQKPM